MPSFFRPTPEITTKLKKRNDSVRVLQASNVNALLNTWGFHICVTTKRTRYIFYRFE